MSTKSLDMWESLIEPVGLVVDEAARFVFSRLKSNLQRASSDEERMAIVAEFSAYREQLLKEAEEGAHAKSPKAESHAFLCAWCRGPLTCPAKIYQAKSRSKKGRSVSCGKPECRSSIREGLKKTICSRGHDTAVCGRDGIRRRCRECRREDGIKREAALSSAARVGGLCRTCRKNPTRPERLQCALCASASVARVRLSRSRTKVVSKE